jgi:hypothetical protein
LPRRSITYEQKGQSMATREIKTRRRKTRPMATGRAATRDEYAEYVRQSEAMGGDPPPASRFFPAPREASD